LGGWDDRDDMLNYLLSLRLRAPEPDNTPRDDSIRWIAGFRERQIVRNSGQWRSAWYGGKCRFSISQRQRQWQHSSPLAERHEH